MKRIIAMVLGLVSALTVIAQEVKPGKTEVIDLGKDVKLEMVLIPVGKFIMGSPAVTKWIIEQRLHYNGCFAAARGHTAATPVKSNSSALIFW